MEWQLPFSLEFVTMYRNTLLATVLYWDPYVCKYINDDLYKLSPKLHYVQAKYLLVCIIKTDMIQHLSSVIIESQHS